MKRQPKCKVYVTRHLPDQAWDKLIQACEVEIWNEEYPPSYEELRRAISDKEGLLCLLTDRIDADLIEAAPNLRVISQCAVGHDNIDIAAAIGRGIVVGNTPGVLTDATADFTFSLLVAAARRLGEAIEYVRAGKWETWGLTLMLGHEIYGATLGIVGFGRIGQAVAKRARGFDMTMAYYDTQRTVDAEKALGIEYRPLEDLLRESDFVTLHVNLSAETHGLMNSHTLSLMKKTAILINTSRGPVVESEALYTALKTKQIAYAALDVTDPEPLPADHKLLKLSNLIITPHIASATVTARNRMASIAVDNLIAGVRGEPLPYQVITAK